MIKDFDEQKLNEAWNEVKEKVHIGSEVKEIMMKENNIDEATTEMWISEYTKFVFLARVSKDRVVPSAQVQQVWAFKCSIP